MKKSISGVSTLLLMTLMLTSCAAVPESKTEDGVNYAVSNSEKAIEEAVRNGLEDKAQFIEKNGDGYTCVCDLGEGDSTFRINARVTNYGTDTVSKIKAEPDPSALDKEQINKLLFDGAMVENTNTDTESTEADTDGEENAEMVGMQSTRQMHYSGNDGTKRFDTITDAGFFFIDDTLSNQYNKIDLNGGITGDADISDEYTKEMAVNELTDVIRKIAGMDIAVLSSTSTTDGNGNGYYQIKFVSAIDGIPLAINDRDMNSDNIIDSYGEALIGSDGIAKIEATNLLWKGVKADKKEQCLKLGEVLSLLEMYISNRQLSCSKEITFSKCGLEYMAKTDDWTTAELIPVWRFYIPAEQLTESEMGVVAVNDDIPTDIYINAIDGKIEQMN